jgi:hypothetical protein
MRKLFLTAILLVVPAVSPAAPRAIPAINAPDAFPAACVGCHVKEHRISGLLARWNGKVDAKRLAAMQGFVPKGITLKGKHPTVPVKDVPASCLKCHAAASKTIPPLAPLMHGVHFGRGDASDFIAKFGGECTHCHKFDKTSGTWRMPSGPEQ